MFGLFFFPFFYGVLVKVGGLLVSGPCLNFFFLRCNSLTFFKGCDSTCMIHSSSKYSNTQIQSLSMCHFSVTYTISIIDKHQFNSHRFSTKKF